MNEQPSCVELPVLPKPPGLGAVCPGCGLGELDYNGLLELECPRCGYVISAGAGCT